MQLDKSRFKDVDAFTSGLSVLTQTSEIHADEMANTLESQITYSKPLIGKNVIIQKKSPFIIHFDMFLNESTLNEFLPIK